MIGHVGCAQFFCMIHARDLSTSDVDKALARPPRFQKAHPVIHEDVSPLLVWILALNLHKGVEVDMGRRHHVVHGKISKQKNSTGMAGNQTSFGRAVLTDGQMPRDIRLAKAKSPTATSRCKVIAGGDAAEAGFAHNLKTRLHHREFTARLAIILLPTICAPAAYSSPRPSSRL